MRKTRWDSGEACLTESEAKVSLIKENKAFEGVQSGIDRSIDQEVSWRWINGDNYIALSGIGNKIIHGWNSNKEREII